MGELLWDLAGDIAAQMQNVEVLAYALLNAIALGPKRRLVLRELAALLVRFALCLLICATANAVLDLFIDNFLLQFVVAGALCCALVHGLALPKRVTMSSILISAWIYSSSLFVVFSQIASALSLELSLRLPITVMRVVYMAIVLAAVWAVDRWLMGSEAEVSPQFAVLMLAICLSGVVTQLLLFATTDYTSTEGYDRLIVCMGTQVADLVAYAMFALTVRNHDERLRAQAEQAAAEKQVEALRAFRLSEQSLRELRHEVKNQYAYIATLLERRDYEAAEVFFGEMRLRADPTLALVATGNQLVDDIVNLELAKARAEGIEVDARIVVPAHLPYEELDLCSLLTNLLDNAIEECQRVGAREVSLNITADLDAGALVVGVSNPCGQAPGLDDAGRFVSKKSEPGHGHGTAIVRRIAEKYDGVADFSCSKGVFRARVMLALNEGEEA